MAAPRPMEDAEAAARGAMADWFGAVMWSHPSGADWRVMESDPDPDNPDDEAALEAKKAALAAFKGRPGGKGCAQARVAVRRELRGMGEAPACDCEEAD